MSKDEINSPDHYKTPAGMEAIEVIESFVADPSSVRRGNVLKYLLRAGKKGPALTDLKKAAWYLSREIAALEKAGK